MFELKAPHLGRLGRIVRKGKTVGGAHHLTGPADIEPLQQAVSGCAKVIKHVIHLVDLFVIGRERYQADGLAEKGWINLIVPRLGRFQIAITDKDLKIAAHLRTTAGDVSV